MNPKIAVKLSLLGFFVVFMAFQLWGCKTHSKNTTTTTLPPKTTEQQQQSSAAPVRKSSPPKVPDNQKAETIYIKGEFRNTTGVMDLLSCYCNHGGYVTSEKMGEMAVCFDKLPNKEQLNCGMVAVEGSIKVMQIGPRQNNPCPAGEMKVIMATQATCY